MSDEVVISYDFINDQLAENLDDIFGVKNSFIEVNPGKVLLPPKFKELGQQILDFKVRPDDIWLICYPRSGNEFHFFTFFWSESLSFLFTYVCRFNMAAGNDLVDL